MFYIPLFYLNKDGKVYDTEWAFNDEVLNPKSTIGFDEDEELEDELDMVGVNNDDLSLMDEDERCEALEEAGLDPDHYYDKF